MQIPLLQFTAVKFDEIQFSSITHVKLRVAFIVDY